MTTIRELQREIHATAKAKGWYDTPRTPGDMITLIHSELSEAYEEFRNGNPLWATWEENGKPEGFPVEIADAIIRILDMCEYYGIDLESVIQTKMEYNNTRSYRHGNKKS